MPSKLCSASQVAGGVGEAGSLYGLLDDAAVGGGVAAFREEEVAEFHALLLDRLGGLAECEAVGAAAGLGELDLEGPVGDRA